MQNMPPPPPTFPPQILSAPPSKKLIKKSGPSSYKAPLIELVFDAFYLFVPGPPFNEYSEKSDGDSLPGLNK